jgi:hypothetical protein
VTFSQTAWQGVRGYPDAASGRRARAGWAAAARCGAGHDAGDDAVGLHEPAIGVRVGALETHAEAAVEEVEGDAGLGGVDCQCR